MLDDKILRLHQQGLVTGAIAIRLSVESSYVRSVVRNHLATEAKPHYNETTAKRKAAQAKVARAQLALRAAAAELRELSAD